MSGVKYSEVEIERMRKAHQDALQDASRMKASVDSLTAQAKTLLDSIPEGVRNSFGGDIDKATQLLSPPTSALDASMATYALTEAAKTMAGVMESRRKAIRLLCEVKLQKREQKARELIARLEETKGEWNALSNLLGKWRGNEVASQALFLKGVGEKISCGEFPEAERVLEQSLASHKRLLATVTSLEGQDVERRYVLDALRDVCVNDLGWKQLGVAAFQSDASPESPIKIQFNTYSDGIIEFVLRMDGIESHSDFSNEKNGCYKQFDSLSEKLKNHGVTTRFRHKEELGAPPTLIRKGELDEPFGAEYHRDLEKEV